MDMACCSNPVLFLTGTIQTIASLQVLPPITLETKPLKNLKVTVTDAIFVIPAHQATFVIVMITGTETITQLFVTTRAKISMMISVINQGPLLFAIISMIMTPADGSRNLSLLPSLAWNRNVQCPPSSQISSISSGCHTCHNKATYSWKGSAWLSPHWDCCPQEHSKGVICIQYPIQKLPNHVQGECLDKEGDDEPNASGWQA